MSEYPHGIDGIAEYVDGMHLLQFDRGLHHDVPFLAVRFQLHPADTPIVHRVGQGSAAATRVDAITDGNRFGGFDALNAATTDRAAPQNPLGPEDHSRGRSPRQ